MGKSCPSPRANTKSANTWRFIMVKPSPENKSMKLCLAMTQRATVLLSPATLKISVQNWLPMTWHRLKPFGGWDINGRKKAAHCLFAVCILSGADHPPCHWSQSGRVYPLREQRANFATKPKERRRRKRKRNAAICCCGGAGGYPFFL